MEGLGGGVSPSVASISPEALDEMQKSAIAGIEAKADPRILPVIRGRDRGMPAAPPVFDIDEMRKRNAAVAARRSKHV